MNQTLINHLSETYLYGSIVKDIKYANEIALILSVVLKKPKDIQQIKEIYKELGPCTIVTYRAYQDIIGKIYPKKLINIEMIRELLNRINDITLFETAI